MLVTFVWLTKTSILSSKVDTRKKLRKNIKGETGQTSQIVRFYTKIEEHAQSSLGWWIQNWSRIWNRILVTMACLNKNRENQNNMFF